MAVAREFALHARSVEDKDFTAWKLQKLLYYAQCLSQYERSRDLFSERVKAWRDGPVVPPVFKVFQGRQQLPLAGQQLNQPSGLSEEDRLIVDRVWQRYGHMTGEQLRAKTHSEMAYRLAREHASWYNDSPPIQSENMRAEVELQKQQDASAFAAFASGLQSAANSE